MLRLRNIRKRSKSIIEADYSPEDSKWWGRISLDLETGKMSYEKHPEYGDSYIAHAKMKLTKIAEANLPIKDCKVMWY